MLTKITLVSYGAVTGTDSGFRSSGAGFRFWAICGFFLRQGFRRLPYAGSGGIKLEGRVFFDIVGKTGVELAKVEGAYGLGRNALNQGIRPSPPLRLKMYGYLGIFAYNCAYLRLTGKKPAKPDG